MYLLGYVDRISVNSYMGIHPDCLSGCIFLYGGGLGNMLSFPFLLVLICQCDGNPIFCVGVLLFELLQIYENRSLFIF